MRVAAYSRTMNSPPPGARFLVALALCSFPASAQVPAGITSTEAETLRGIFRNRIVAYARRPDANPAVLEIYRAYGRRPPGLIDTVATYQGLAKGIALMTDRPWDEPRQVAAAFDMRLPTKLAEPGETIRAKVFPLYKRAQPLTGRYQVHLSLRDPAGGDTGIARDVQLTEAAATDLTFDLPPSLAPGRYQVEYVLRRIEESTGDSEAGSAREPAESALVSATRNLYVLDDVRARLAALQQRHPKLRKKFAKRSVRHRLAVTTIEWLLGEYGKAARNSYPGPPILIASMRRWGRNMEPVDYVRELGAAEKSAQALEAGRDPLAGRKGDLHLAHRSSAMKRLSPFRLFVPSRFQAGESYPLAVALHGAGSDENAYMDFYEGAFRKNAEQRGYIAVSPLGQGPYGGFWESDGGGREVMEVITLVQKAYPVDKKRTYLTGHSMGGGGTIHLGFNHPDRFAALAPVAGFFGQISQLGKAKKMPLLIAQGETDRVVKTERARALYQAARQSGMPNVKYLELPGIGHFRIAQLVMGDVFDWFDRHAKE